VLKAMQEKDMIGSKTGQMKFNHIDDETVVRFMASSLNDEIKEQIKQEVGQMDLSQG